MISIRMYTVEVRCPALLVKSPSDLVKLTDTVAVESKEPPPGWRAEHSKESN